MAKGSMRAIQAENVVTAKAQRVRLTQSGPKILFVMHRDSSPHGYRARHPTLSTFEAVYFVLQSSFSIELLLTISLR